MAYSTDILSERVTIQTPGTEQGSTGARTVWTDALEVWANVSWTKGTRALRNGEVAAYDTILVRMRFNATATKQCRLTWRGESWAITSLYADKRANTIQITAVQDGYES